MDYVLQPAVAELRRPAALITTSGPDGAALARGRGATAVRV